MTSYNYKYFIGDTIDSVLVQSRPADEIIVVDDGSSDGSAELLNERYHNKQNVKIILKENGGQLSAINEGYRHSSGDIICFLDSDDQYEEKYLEKIEQIYVNNPQIQYITSAYREFGNRDGTISRYNTDADLGITPVGVYFGNIWTSGPTATISARKSMLDQYFPVPYEKDWVISPDACISIGASMVGARKYFLANPLIKYRIHDNNAHVVKKLVKYRAIIVKFKFMDFAIKKNNMPMDRLVNFIYDEFCTITDKNVKKSVFFKYLKIVIRSNKSLLWKAVNLAKIIFKTFCW